MVVRPLILMALLLTASTAEARSGVLQSGLPYEASQPTMEDVGQGMTRWRMKVNVTNTATHDITPFLDSVLHLQQPIRSPVDNALVSWVNARPDQWNLPPGQTHEYVIETRFPSGGTISIVEAFPFDDCTKTSAEIVEKIVNLAKAYPQGETKAREQWLSDFSDRGNNLGKVVPGCQGTYWQARACLSPSLVPLPATPTQTDLSTRDYTDANVRNFEIKLEINSGRPYSSLFWSEDARVTGGGASGGGPTCGNNSQTSGLHAQLLDDKLYTCLVNGTYHLLAYYNYERIEHHQFEVTDVPPEMQCGAKSNVATLLEKFTPGPGPLLLIGILALLVRRRAP